MARPSSVLLIVIVFHLACFEARKLLNLEKEQDPSFKGDFAAVGDDKGQAMANNERLFAIHLPKIDRILQSTPSPGGGHH
ncbi:hypothetical protein F3Y22_tig00111191pilonHSYRG00201 [Hibiscus syriacus]|uniref:Uncharacterized protein n=1 Tax=Hibiscus syriacus TaxID=106335 RepID=A0A6A2YW67_HIBSY|nr:hypothetical protein F3Y22_tig00111191pilonHSYRG00201 [Hibiscus syriacus]